VGRAWLYLNASGQLSSDLGGATLTISSTVSTGEWHHAALVYDGADLNIYLDGVLEGRAARTMESSNGVLLIGANQDLASDLYAGKLDEMNIFERALSSEEVYYLSLDELVGLDAVDVWLQAASFDDAPVTPDWGPAVLDAPGELLSGWAYTLPVGLEGFYQINLRASDAFSNTGRTNTMWRGLIDMIAPQVSFMYHVLGSGDSVETEYFITIDDYVLDESSLAHPCSPGDLALSYYPVDYSLPPLAEELYQGSGWCRVPGPPAGSETVTACDLTGNCTTSTPEDAFRVFMQLVVR